jgi:nucleoside-diphosphate-sugar epimerase
MNGCEATMRLLLIGGNGFIGKPLMRKLTTDGHSVAVLHRNPAGNYPDDVIAIQGDRNRLLDSLGQIQRFAPDVIVDLIPSSGEQAHHLMSVARGVAQRVVAISSMDVYRAWGVLYGIEPGGLESLPITEDSALRTNRQLDAPETLRMMRALFSWVDERYDKIAVEEAVLKNPHVAGTILRLPMLYGPGDPVHRFFPLLKRFADGRASVILSEDMAAWRGPRGYIENIVHAIALAAISDRAAGCVYNVCDEPVFPELEWQKRIAAQAKWAADFVVLPVDQTPKHLLQPGNAAQHIVVTAEKIRMELHYEEPVSIDEAIRRTISWEHQNPPAMINTQQFDYPAEDAALRACA